VRASLQLHECESASVGWERKDKQEMRAVGEDAIFIDLESGGRPVHAPCPIGRAPNPVGQHLTRPPIFLLLPTLHI